MAKLKITTPVADYSGFCGNVEFVDGVGYADPDTHAAEIAYCERNGYTIVDPDADDQDVEDIEDPAADDSADDDRPPPADAGGGDPQAPKEPAPPAGPAGPAGDDKMPARNGSADAWRAYATAHGMDPDEAAELSRDQLVERFTSKEENK